MSDEQTNVGPEAAAPAGRKPGQTRGTALKVTALAAAVVCLVLAIGAACKFGGGRNEETSPNQTPADEGPADSDSGLFHLWPKPDFVVVLSAQMHGYIQPCGCSDPQFGSLARRYNFIESLRRPREEGGRGWDVVAYDLGDIPQIAGPAKLANLQGLIKYRYAMEALKRIGYSAVSFGEYEAAQPLNKAIDEYALNESQPAVLAANLIDKAKLFEDKDKTGDEWGKSYVGSWQMTRTPGGIKVGALGIIGKNVGGQITAADPRFKFGPANVAAGNGLTALARAGAEFRVVLYQGPIADAKLIPPVDPTINVILCLDDADEPPGSEDRVGNTFIVRMGHKGKYIGVVGVYLPKQAGKPIDMRYQLVSMGPQYTTKPGDEAKHPVIKLMERYTRELKEDNYLARYGKIPHTTQVAVKGMPGLAKAPSGYVGSEACMKCHNYAWTVWNPPGAKSGHSKAYDTLVTKAKNPSLREYDPECIVCHTVGFRYQGGFANDVATPKLKNVGCESCHGPCEAHVKNPNNGAIHALINPWKAPNEETPEQQRKRILRIEGMCQECHDPENDVHWNFAAKWLKIKHMTADEDK
jgi:Cytochrome c554 and c-prime